MFWLKASTLYIYHGSRLITSMCFSKSRIHLPTLLPTSLQASLETMTTSASQTIKHVVALNEDANIAWFQNDTRKFRIIRVVIHTTGAWPGTPHSDNHVSLYLLLDENTSVQINMMTDEDDLRGQLVWSRHNYQDSNSRIVSRDYEFGQPVEVRQLYHMIRYEWGLHMYMFSGGGSGCHYWVCYSVLTIYNYYKG